MTEYSNSGKRYRTAIACVNLDVRSVVNPIRFYEARRVILLTNDDENDPLYPLSQKVLEEIRSELKEHTVAIHPIDIHDCYVMMRDLWIIVCSEKVDYLRELYVNLSSGTIEFAIAAMSVCRTIERVVAFTVRTKAYTFTSEDIHPILFGEIHPPGISEEVNEPVMVMMMDLDRSKTYLVECLKVINEMRIDERNVSFSDIIARMKDDGIWDYNPDRRRGKTDDAQKERMFLKRNFLNPMIELKWIEEDRAFRNRFRLTPQGRMILEVYYGG